MLFIDLDHFKQVNDTHGPEAGDAVLVAVSACLRGGTRASDTVGRIGGEEFAILLPGTDLEGALLAAEKTRASCEGLAITASIGVATLGQGISSFAQLQAEADSSSR